MIGTTIGHFRVLEQIGAGGMGVVYRAHDTMLDRDVALKVISPKILVDDAVRQRFRKEALSVARLSHPNIATVFEMGSQGGTDFIVTELIPGIALDAKLRQAHALPEKEVLELALQLLDGLDAAHHQGVIHRDLKPSNLCMTAQGRLKIIDFGLALLKQTPADVESTVTITDPLEIRGTVPYMAPEQLRGEDLDARTDLWAVGVVLYELVTHQLPFPGTTSTAIAADIIHRQPIWPRVIQPEISAEFEKVILKSLEKDRRHRYQSANEVSADLKRLDHQFMRVGSKQDDPAVPLALELAHVLFMDIVGYSKLPMDQQRHCVYQLQELVSRTSDFIQAKRVDQLIALPTGDGMALAFFGDVQAPVRCAVELAQMVRPTGIEIRMGIHTGPVYRVADINANRNVTGGGINIAQRVMDCGDGGHILLSKAVADVLGEVTTWRSILRDLGEVTVKHGVRIHVYSLYTGEAGHPELPQKGRDDPNSVPAGITERLLQAAAPKESTIGTSIEIIAMVSEFGSPGLRTLLEEEAIPGLTSNDVRQRQFKINFPRDHQGNLQPVDISLRLDSPEFVPPTQTKKLRVPAEGDSVPCSFLIRPIVIGDLVVNLELLKGEEVVASRSIRTRALDHGRPVHPGKTIVCLPITIVASPSLLDKIRDVKQDIRDIDPRLLTKLGRVIPSTASPNEVRTDLGGFDGYGCFREE